MLLLYVVTPRADGGRNVSAYRYDDGYNGELVYMTPLA